MSKSIKEENKKESLKKAKKIEKEAKKKSITKTKKEIKDLKIKRKETKDKTKKKELTLEIKNKKKETKKKGDTFISQVLEEMKLVRWPKASEVVKYSIASFVFILIFALFFFGIDALFALVKDLID